MSILSLRNAGMGPLGSIGKKKRELNFFEELDKERKDMKVFIVGFCISIIVSALIIFAVFSYFAK